MGAHRRSASRSQGTENHPAAHFVRFTEEQNGRLHDAVKREGKRSVQGFLHEVAMAAIVESEQKDREDAEYRERRRVEQTARRPDPTRGLGIRDRILARTTQPTPPRAREDESTPSQSPAPQIVVAVPSVPADADLDGLATYVVDGNRWSHPTRLATARDVVTASSAADTRERRLKSLDDKIAALDKREQKTESLLDRFLR